MPRILVIDDEEIVRYTLRKVLERSGYEVMVASNGAEGIQLFRENPADLIITDILMPEQDGLKTIAALCEESPGVKIIAMSGGGRTGRLDFLPAAEHLGAVLTLLKPLPPSELLEAVEMTLGTRLRGK